MSHNYTTSTALYNNAIYGLTQSIVSTTVVDYHIANAEATIDSYVSKQYTLPFDAKPNTPPILFRIATDLAAFNVLNYLYSQTNQNVNNWVKELYSRSMESLKEISEDKMRIIYASGTLATMDININLETNLEGIPLIANMDDVLNWRVAGTLSDKIFSDRADADSASVAGIQDNWND